MNQYSFIQDSLGGSSQEELGIQLVNTYSIIMYAKGKTDKSEIVNTEIQMFCAKLNQYAPFKEDIWL